MTASVLTGTHHFSLWGSRNVVELRDIDKPVSNDDQVLLRVHAVTINVGEWFLTSGQPYGGTREKIPTKRWDAWWIVRLFTPGMRDGEDR